MALVPSNGAVTFALAATVVGSWTVLRRWLSEEAPRAPRRRHAVEFGKVAAMEKYATPELSGVERLMEPPRLLEDPFHWLRDDSRTDEEVLAVVRAENRYADARTELLDGFRETLYKEFKGRLKEDDVQVPYRRGPFFYYTKTVEGLSYPLLCRQRAKPESSTTPRTPEEVGGEEVVVLDENVLAEGTTHCDVQDWEPSESHRLFAYSIDTSGDERYTIRVVELLEGGEHQLIEEIEDTDGGIEWGGEDFIFYSTLDEQHRPHRVWQHKVGSPQSEDKLLFQEDNELFWLGFGKSKSNRFLFIGTSSKTTSEVHALDLHTLTSPSASPAPLVLVSGREEGHRYRVSHWGEVLLIVSNGGGELREGGLFVTLASKPSRENWVQVLPYEGGIRQIVGIVGYAEFAVITGRQEGLPQVWVLGKDHLESIAAAATAGTPPSPPPPLTRIPTKDTVYTISTSSYVNDYDTTSLRFSYASPTSPSATLQASIPTLLSNPPNPLTALSVLKQTPVPNTDPSLYACARVWAPTGETYNDREVRVPISLLWKKTAGEQKRGEAASGGGGEGETEEEHHATTSSSSPPSSPFEKDGGAPTVLYAYGAYGASMDRGFSTRWLSICDRGGLVAVAHVRGGGEMGRYWYEELGKFKKKQNTFADVITAAEFLSKTGWSRRDKIVSMGASAGGLTVGRALTARPDLWAGVVGEVPFVDLMVTMSDPTIPLTNTEWKEWGNPHSPEYFEYMKEYSPMDTVRKGTAYPPVLLTGGLHDPRVQYWEPLKFAQRLRYADRNNGEDVIVKIDMTSGHFSASDRYKLIREDAFVFAWIIDKLGITLPPAEEEEEEL